VSITAELGTSYRAGNGFSCWSIDKTSQHSRIKNASRAEGRPEIRSNGSYRAYNYNGFNTSERVEPRKVGEICKVVSEEFKILLC
jgi:hypothetical protein